MTVSLKAVCNSLKLHFMQSFKCDSEMRPNSFVGKSIPKFMAMESTEADWLVLTLESEA